MPLTNEEVQRLLIEPMKRTMALSGIVDREMTPEEERRVDTLRAKQSRIEVKIAKLQEELEPIEDEIDRLTRDRSNSIIDRMTRKFELPAGRGDLAHIPKFARVNAYDRGKP